MGSHEVELFSCKKSILRVFGESENLKREDIGKSKIKEADFYVSNFIVA
jgi:hypothetical protein